MIENATVASVLLNEHNGQIVREVSRALGYDLACFDSVDEFVTASQATPFGLLVMPLDGQACQSLRLQELLRSSLDPVCFVYFAAQSQISDVVQAMKLGAISVVSPEEDRAGLAETLKVAAATYVLRRAWIDDVQAAQQKIGELSGRQRQVMRRTVAGHTNRAIGQELDVSTKTIEKHRQLIYERTGSHSLPELVRLDFIARRSPDAAFSLNAASRKVQVDLLPKPLPSRKNGMRNSAVTCGLH